MLVAALEVDAAPVTCVRTAFWVRELATMWEESSSATPRRQALMSAGCATLAGPSVQIADDGSIWQEPVAGGMTRIMHIIFEAVEGRETFRDLHDPDASPYSYHN